MNRKAAIHYHGRTIQIRGCGQHQTLFHSHVSPLHLGEVMYGNIGSGNRLDFTCIGPAVNLAARLEKIAAGLGRSIILSAEFARHCRAELEHLGEFTAAGFAAAQTAFGVSSTSAVKPGADTL